MPCNPILLVVKMLAFCEKTGGFSAFGILYIKSRLSVYFHLHMWMRGPLCITAGPLWEGR
jgi:hypothetical protein